ncbi:amino acid permease [Nocardia sp. CDC159]|uniref:Amino acid permease n=1 Tax=Nocardia pulmonis TaxID=2951408 RepID=A0A9X2E617_9NOCA|nr:MULTISPECIES: amino acid permease [Nocardia]MCM6774320.1 amino acid permease [Nocardia pulmonis]MCM6787614.1 amino acid permease [Nocardia sp. CDC159]
MPRGSNLFRTKSIEQSIADTDEPQARLRKVLTVWDLTLFGVAVVIGTGVFTLAASTAGNLAGPAVSLSYLLAAVACGLAALCYAEFSSTVPVAGSAYTYSYAVFGEFVAWILGWDLILEFALASAVVARGWSTYLAQCVELITGTTLPTLIPLPLGLRLDWAAVLVVAALCTMLALGTKLSSRVNQVVTGIKIAVVLLVIIAGIAYIEPANYSPFIPPAEVPNAGNSGGNQSLFSLFFGEQTSTYGMLGVLAAASLLCFAFIGFDMVATTAEEARNPQRDMPRGILAALAIVTTLYIAVSLVVTGMVPYTDLKSRPDGTKATLASAFAQLGVDWAATVIAIGALIGLTTVMIVTLLGQTRVLFAMSRDGLMPRRIAVTGERGTPVRATWVVGAVVMVIAGLCPAEKLEEMVNIGTLSAFVLVSIGVIVLRRKRPDLQRGFRTPLVPLVPILSALACGWLMVNLSVLTWVRFLIWMLIGVALYFCYGIRHSVLGERQRAAADRETVESKILVTD